ncbi:MAG TPA: flagellar hook-basal body complex protein FliE [Spirochaetota bacterium]|nr:flagellar hook-basal body complex protein FliE [Spirochaetota bacterium]HPH02639.1 flagellar hook-basal body complex protein FliE [Spirochaetota bacterium]
MKLYGNDEVSGNRVLMKAVHPDHYRIEKSKEGDDDVAKSFNSLLSDSFGKVNNLLVQSDRTTQQMIVEPESVSIHTVMIAAQKAEMALSLAKAVTDRVIRAYSEITNLR